MKPCLADLNFLLPVVVRSHPHHAVALSWYREQAAGRIGVCRFVQLGLIRLLGNSRIMRDRALSGRAAWDLTAELLTDERVEFWQEPLGLDEWLPRLLRYPGPTPSLVADAYLAAFAITRRVAVVTFDAGFRQFKELSLELLPSSS
jgi:uncharacterized protein